MQTGEHHVCVCMCGHEYARQCSLARKYRVLEWDAALGVDQGHSTPLVYVLWSPHSSLQESLSQGLERLTPLSTHGGTSV